MSDELGGGGRVAERMRQVAETIEATGRPFAETAAEFLVPLDRSSLVWSIIESGEIADRLDEACLDAAGELQKKADAAANLLISAVPKIIYLLIVVFVAWLVVCFWTGIFARINCQL